MYYEDEDIYITSDKPMPPIEELEDSNAAVCANCRHWFCAINCNEFGDCGALYSSNVYTRADFCCQWFDQRTAS